MSGVVLMKVENRTFEAQTVMGTGFYYVNCRFVDCTVIVRNGPGGFERCGFSNCNWHLDILITPGDPTLCKMVRSLLDHIESGGADYSIN